MIMGGFGVKCPFPQEGHPLFCFCMDSLLNLKSLVIKKIDLSGKKVGYLTLKTLKSCFWGLISIFSRDAATLYERVSVRPLVRRSVTLLHFGLLGATYGRVSGLVFFSKKR